MRMAVRFLVMCSLLLRGLPVFGQDPMIEQLLRAQVFNRAFEGFSYYHITIEDDRPQADGSREVTAVASGTFLQNTKRIKVLLVIVGDQVVGGQVLEGADLPPCRSAEQSQTS